MRGLVLEGGGIRGAYQIGSYYAFVKNHVKFDGFVGASIGAFNAAMMACGKHKELLDIWYRENPAMFLGIDEKVVAGFNDQKMNLSFFFDGINELKTIVKNFGVDNTKLMNKADELLKLSELKKSKKDFGLITVRVTKKGFQPVYKYVEDINSQEELIEYIMASCYFPIFREKRMIDNHYYIDGGFYDNSPVRMLLKKKYDELYVINCNGVGHYHKIKHTDARIINIKPSRDNGGLFELNHQIIKDNIMMGYYDTLRVLRNLDGYKYCFKNKKESYYKYLCRKVDKRLLRRVSNFFDVYSYKNIILKALEYVMEKEHYDYYNVYNLYGVVKKIPDKKHFVYKFVKELKLFF